MPEAYSRIGDFRSGRMDAHNWFETEHTLALLALGRRITCFPLLRSEIEDLGVITDHISVEVRAPGLVNKAACNRMPYDKQPLPLQSEE